MNTRSILRTGLCQKAYRFALAKHGDQKRKYTGEPYINHPVEVAVTLDWAGEDEATVCAGFLHDTIEDTDTTFFELIDEFGVDIATLVVEVTDVAPPGPNINRARRKEIERNHLRSASPRGKSVKLADTLSNTPSILALDPGFGRVYLQEKRLLLPYLREGNPLLFEEARRFLGKATA
jgi:(p)ppGpp synthase/HD superfamily hydrolase